MFNDYYFLTLCYHVYPWFDSDLWWYEELRRWFGRIELSVLSEPVSLSDLLSRWHKRNVSRMCWHVSCLWWYGWLQQRKRWSGLLCVARMVRMEWLRSRDRILYKNQVRYISHSYVYRGSYIRVVVITAVVTRQRKCHKCIIVTVRVKSTTRILNLCIGDTMALYI